MEGERPREPPVDAHVEHDSKRGRLLEGERPREPPGDEHVEHDSTRGRLLEGERPREPPGDEHVEHDSTRGRLLEGERPREPPHWSPLHRVQFALKRPLFGRFDQLCTHRIIPHIQPFGAILFSGAHLRVPAV